jgi:Trk K+ transport system NAD-binding subunit
MADGRPVKEVHWPAGCTLVAVRRGRAVLVPEGDTLLQADDIITGFGAAGARTQVLERLRASSDDTTETGQTVPIE